MLRTPEQTPYFTDLVEKIRSSDSIVLSTHRQADGDGVGAQVALYHALRKIGKKVRILNVDAMPKKYRFLQTDQLVQVYQSQHQPLERSDLALVFDTNDYRLVEPLFSELQRNCNEVLFVDHHPALLKGPPPTPGSLIATAAASTGEITFFLIRALGIELDATMARALYASIVFDTQMFRYIRGSANSHLIAAELLRFEQHPEEVHRALMANHTAQKIAFLASALGRIEYFADDKLAVVKLRRQDFTDFQLEWDESGDVIDLIMNIETLEAACLFRQDGKDEFKLSLRSKGNIEVVGVAEAMGGGGHLYSSGAFLQGTYGELKKKVLNLLLSLLAEHKGRGTGS